MKIVLATLSGDSRIARAGLRSRYSNAEIAELPRSILSDGSFLHRLKNLRDHKPDIFAVMCESLPWQFGKDALMLFGALAGAGESTIIDPRGGCVTDTRVNLLLRVPARIASARLAGRRAFREADKLITGQQQRHRPSIAQRTTGQIRIAYFRTTPSAGTTPGGASSHIKGVINGLTDLGAEVEIVSNDRLAGIEHSSPHFHELAPDRDAMPRAAFDVANGLSFAKRASEIVAKLKPTFIYERYSRFSVAGVAASLRHNIPLFLEYNGSEVWVGTHWDSTARLDLLERYEQLNLDAATRIFVVSEVERETLVGRGVTDEKIIVNPNGVDPDLFRPGAGGEKVRVDLRIDKTAIVAGFVGTFGPWHGVTTLAEAIAAMPRDLNLNFLLIGEGSLRAEVEENLRATGNSDRVRFTGAVPHESVAAYLDACDILVSPHVPLAAGAEFFGSPTKLFEYMAMSKAIVASRLGQIGDVLTDDETAILVEPGNVRELGDAILKLSNDDALRARLGEAARSAAVSRHTWRQNAERVLEAFQRLGSADE